MTMTAARFLVSGHVQGVSFRASCRQQAIALGLRGMARNRDDGHVEVTVHGQDGAIDALAQWLQHGPPDAGVQAVQRHLWTGAVPEGFAIG